MGITAASARAWIAQQGAADTPTLHRRVDGNDVQVLMRFGHGAMECGVGRFEGRAHAFNGPVPDSGTHGFASLTVAEVSQVLLGELATARSNRGHDSVEAPGCTQ